MRGFLLFVLVATATIAPISCSANSQPPCGTFNQDAANSVQVSSEVLSGDDRKHYVQQQAAGDEECAGAAYRRGALSDGRSFFAAALDLYDSAADDALTNRNPKRAAGYLQAEIAVLKQLALIDPAERRHVEAQIRDTEGALKKLTR